jgi:cytochrome c biogenesis protein CcdA
MSLAIVILAEKSVMRRLALFGLAVTLGVLIGVAWVAIAADWAYWGFLQLFLDPRAQIANLGFGLAIGFLAGFVHIVRPCFIGAVSAGLPLAQIGRDRTAWLRSAGVFTTSMVVVTAAWGAVVAVLGGTFAEIVGNPKLMRDGMAAVLPVMGLLLLGMALGELGLAPRLLPDIPHGLDPMAVSRIQTGHHHDRALAGLGIVVAATFGIVCTRPTYLALLVYVGTAGSVVYGALALGAYGLGMGLSLSITALGLYRLGMSERVGAWLSAKQTAIRITQGMILAALGAIPIWFFWAREALTLR